MASRLRLQSWRIWGWLESGESALPSRATNASHLGPIRKDFYSVIGFPSSQGLGAAGCA